MRLRITVLACLLLLPAALPAVAADDAGCQPTMVDLTPPEVSALLELGTVAPVGPLRSELRAGGSEKISSRDFVIYDDQGNLIGGGNTTCTGSCGGSECSLSGCEVETAGCSHCSCSGLNCNYACTCVKKSSGRAEPAPGPAPGPDPVE